MNIGFPELTDSFLAGQDVLYRQFNDIDFYIEDTGQEHLYFNLLKGLFDDLKLEKIFPLNGKSNVKNAARVNAGDKTKVYLVDLDFDDVLGRKEELPNLFYLRRYSIENYLISKGALYEMMRHKNPKLKDSEIVQFYDHDLMIETASKCLLELACAFVVIQEFNLGIRYYGVSPSRDFDFSEARPKYREAFIGDYLQEVERALKAIDGRYTLQSRASRHRNLFDSAEKAVGKIPGKCLLIVIKNRLVSNGSIYQTSDESFVYALSKDFALDELQFLRIQIAGYIH